MNCLPVVSIFESVNRTRRVYIIVPSLACHAERNGCVDVERSGITINEFIGPNEFVAARVNA